MSPVRYQRHGAIGVIEVSAPPVNALSHAVRSGLMTALDQALADQQAIAIVLSAAGRTFMAGADIAEFGQPLLDPNLPEVVAAFERSAKPVVAALHGTVLGGGLELALGCHYRIADARTQLGLPEIKLGLIPGAGGTQRLPRLIDPAAALELMLSGKPIDAERALALGLVDQVVADSVFDAALAFAGTQRATRPLSAALPRPSNPDFIASTRAQKRRHPSGTAAPSALIDAIEAALTQPFDAGLAVERAAFATLYDGAAARALWHVFFAERACAKLPDIDASVAPRAIESVVVIGAGTMGRGIAQAIANAGLKVCLTDTDPQQLERAGAEISGAWAQAHARGTLSAAALKARTAALRFDRGLDAVATADLVIEAVFESLGLKKQVFVEIDRRAKPDAILASNTSTLDLDAIAAVTGRPRDVVGLHFFSPAPVMRLLEIVRGAQTAPNVVASAFAFAKRIGKIAVQARVGFGFIGNRMIEAYLEEALHLLLEGVPVRAVDAAMEDYGMAMGPFTMADLAGLDVGYRIRRERQLSAEQQRLFRLPDALVESGRLGQKSGAGFYDYPNGARTPTDSLSVAQTTARIANELAVPPLPSNAAAIVERLLKRLVNEGAKVLDEGIALRASDIDIVYLNGYGFPAWRGGPMYAASIEGWPAFRHRLQALAARHGARFAPARYLTDPSHATRST
jgi:3-hydroxyacyl-CoA dehydrogenase